MSSSPWWTRLLEFMENFIQQFQTDRARLIRFLASLVLTFALLRRLTTNNNKTRNVIVKAAAAPPPIDVVSTNNNTPTWKPYSTFLNDVDKGVVSKVIFNEDDIVEWTTNNSKLSSITPPPPPTFQTRRVPSHLYPIVSKLAEKQIEFEQIISPPPPPRSLLSTLLLIALPAAYIGFLGYVMYRFMGPDATLGSNNVGENSTDNKKNKTRFIDVAGADEARQAVKEVCDVLKNPDKYLKAGARLPKGLLLVGPPGSGKTMLARAMAAEAGIPFFYCAGSDFVEVFAGRGAARVRSLFQRASKNAPAVIFIDEIDALGGARHMGGFSMSNNEEREQTLNQLLSCMDGFDSDTRVVVIAATNRFDSLDRALVRPGRFDRIVRVELPNDRGRVEILKVHTRELQLAPDVDLHKIASRCHGFSGAELAALANEAAIRAVRRDRQIVTQNDFLDALNEFIGSRKNSNTGNNNNSGTGGFTERFANLFKNNSSGQYQQQQQQYQDNDDDDSDSDDHDESNTNVEEVD
jgi:cell division protease FtsH